MIPKDPKLIALRFNDCINSKDLDGLARLMTDDHTFVDREGVVHKPKGAMVEAWRKFFVAFPLYRNTFNELKSDGNDVAILGHAYWSEKQPYDPVIWSATIANDLVREWKIHNDSEENRKRFGFSPKTSGP